MELKDILILAQAGYTREEIAQMENPGTPAPAPAPVVEQTPTPEPQPAPAQAVEPVPAPAPAPAPTPTPAPQEAQPSMAEIMQAISKLTGAVQANAIAQSMIPGGANPQTPTAEDMIAEIIRPTFKERK